jgi:hypothetical protein
VEAVVLDRLHGKEHWAAGMFPALEKNLRRDEVPGALGDDVGGEKIEQLRCIAASVGVGMDLATVSGADAEAGGLDLNPDDTVAEVEGDVEGLGVSPGFQDFVTAAQGFGYELGFDPLAPLLVSSENTRLANLFPAQISLPGEDEAHPRRNVLAQKKRRSPWAAPLFRNMFS